MLRELLSLAPLPLAFLLALGSSSNAQAGTVLSEQKITDSVGGFTGMLDPDDHFGQSVAALGDLDDDGVADLAVGAQFDDDGGSNQGALWILFLNSDGTVRSHQKISETAGGLGGVLDPGDRLGFTVEPLGDLDGDGIVDLAASTPDDDDGGLNEGAVWILFLHADGTVKSTQKISALAGGFGVGLDPGDEFGGSISLLGDLDGDGVHDIAVGSTADDDGGSNQGAVWILFLNANGTVKARQKISETAGGFGGVLDSNDFFGLEAGPLGDLDGDGVCDLAVQAKNDDDGSVDAGAVWILFLNTNGTVKAWQKISATAGGFTGILHAEDWFGSGPAPLGDFDGDGVLDLAVGAPQDDDGSTNAGAVWILFLHTDGTVKASQKISATNGGFGGVPVGHLGSELACLGDLDGDGAVDLAAGEPQPAGGEGAAWILFLEGPDLTPPILSYPPALTILDPKGSLPGEIVTYSVTATDDTDPTPSVVCVPPSGSLFPRGTTLVTCTATDASGNQSTRAFPVTVLPTIRRR